MQQRAGRPAPQGYPQWGQQPYFGGQGNQPGYPPQQGYPQQPYGQPYYAGQQGNYPNGTVPYPPAGQEAQGNSLMTAIKGLPWVQISMYGILPVLFLAGMMVPALAFLKILFIIGALGAVSMLWAKPLVGANLRLLLTAGYAVMTVISLISLLSGNMAPNDRTNSTQSGVSTTQTFQQSVADTTGTAEQVPTSLGTMEDVNTVDVTANNQDPTSSAVDSGEAVRQLQSFFHSWSVNRTDEMVALSAPSWQSSVDDPKKALFGILANRTVLDHTVVSTTGTDADSTRTSTVDATIDKGNGRDPVKYRFQVILLKEGGTWYVDPRSLTSVEAIEEAATATAEPQEAAPTEAPAAAGNGISGNTTLYYNPDGGTKYHLNPKCPDVAARFTPLAGHFTYAQINEAAYGKLKRCTTCNAPVRPVK